MLIGHTECKYFSYLTLLSFKCFVSLFHVHLIRRQCPISEFRYSQLSRELLECSMVLFNFKTHRLFFNAILNYSLLLTSQTLAICSGLFKSPGDLLKSLTILFQSCYDPCTERTWNLWEKVNLQWLTESTLFLLNYSNFYRCVTYSTASKSRLGGNLHLKRLFIPNS